MKRKFTVIIERKGEEYVARCPEVPGVEGHGRDKEEALERIGIKTGDGMTAYEFNNKLYNDLV